MSEWFKEHDWKSCVRLKRTGGSNPLLCANKKKEHQHGVLFLFFEGRVCRISELSEVHASNVRKRLFISSPSSSAERRFVAQRQYIFSALSARFLAFFLCNILESLAFHRIICYTMQKDIYSTIDKCTTSTFWQWQGQVVSFSL